MIPVQQERIVLPVQPVLLIRSASTSPKSKTPPESIHSTWVKGHPGQTLLDNFYFACAPLNFCVKVNFNLSLMRRRELCTKVCTGKCQWHSHNKLYRLICKLQFVLIDVISCISLDFIRVIFDWFGVIWLDLLHFEGLRTTFAFISKRNCVFQIEYK